MAKRDARVIDRGHRYAMKRSTARDRYFGSGFGPRESAPLRQNGASEILAASMSSTAGWIGPADAQIGDGGDGRFAGRAQWLEFLEIPRRDVVILEPVQLQSSGKFDPLPLAAAPHGFFPAAIVVR